MDAADQPWTADRRILRLLQYWRDGRPGPGLLPGRDAIDPVTLGPDLLPLMALVEPVDDGRRFRFRLVGTELARNAGLDLTGRHVDEVNPNKAYAAYISDLYSQCALMRGPLYSETRYRAPGGRTGLTRRLICPLAADGRRIDMFIAVQTFELDAEAGPAPTYTFAEDFRPGPVLPVLCD